MGSVSEANEYQEPWRPAVTRRFAQPRRVAFWLYLFLVTVAAALLVIGIALTALTAPQIMGWLLVAALLWGLWCLVFAWLLRRADSLHAAPIAIVWAAFGWGLVSVAYAGQLEGLGNAIVPTGMAVWGPALVAPLPEEGVKFLGVLLLAGIVPLVVRRPMGAIMCGLMVGLGFAVMEDWVKSGSAIAGAINSGQSVPGALLSLFITRGFVAAPWSHPVWAALSAVGLWYFMTHPDRPMARRLGVLVGLLLGAMVLHGINDSAQGFGPLALVVLGFCWLVDLGLLIGLIVWGRRAERRLFDTMTYRLGPSVIEDGEAASLSTRRGRRRARVRARHGGGEEAARQLALRQDAQLAYINSRYTTDVIVANEKDQSARYHEI